MEKLEELLFQLFLWRMIEKYEADYAMRWISNQCVLEGLDRDAIQCVIVKTFNSSQNLKRCRIECVQHLLNMGKKPTTIRKILQLDGKDIWLVYNVKRTPAIVGKRICTDEECKALVAFRKSLPNIGGLYDRSCMG